MSDFDEFFEGVKKSVFSIYEGQLDLNRDFDQQKPPKNSKVGLH